LVWPFTWHKRRGTDTNVWRALMRGSAATPHACHKTQRLHGCLNLDIIKTATSLPWRPPAWRGKWWAGGAEPNTPFVSCGGREVWRSIPSPHFDSFAMPFVAMWRVKPNNPLSNREPHNILN
jgi:hypothetical protein